MTSILKGRHGIHHMLKWICITFWYRFEKLQVLWPCTTFTWHQFK